MAIEHCQSAKFAFPELQKSLSICNIIIKFYFSGILVSSREKLDT
jgi:hypothetical protein